MIKRTPCSLEYYPCGGLSRTRLAAQIETGSLSRRMCAGLVGNLPGGCMVLYAFLGLVKRASRGTSTCDSYRMREARARKGTTLNKT
jgi:hypothetical protein